MVLDTRCFGVVLILAFQNVLCSKVINFVKTNANTPPALGRPQHLQLQQVSSLVECAMSCSRNTPCHEFQFSNNSSTCITRSTFVVNFGLFVGANGLFDIYTRNPKAPTSCSAIKSSDPTASDGEYYIYPTASQFQGLTIRVYCLMNDTHQLEYVTLPQRNFGEFPKKSNPTCKDEKPYLTGSGVGNDGQVDFRKIRVDPSTMTVTRDDVTFTVVSGSRGSRFKYGNAADCYTQRAACGPIGNFRINTLGTGMKFSDSLNWVASQLTAKITRQENGAVIDVVCGGFCGFCYPDGDMVLYPQRGGSL